MINDELKDILNKLREAAERVNKRCGDQFYDDLTGMCLICSTVVVTAFRRLGLKGARLVHGRCCEDYGIANHCWVNYNDHVIDITATQFRNGFIEFLNRPPSKVEIIPIDETKEAYLPAEELPTTSVEKAYSWAVDSAWPVYQCPYPKLVRSILNESGLFA